MTSNYRSIIIDDEQDSIELLQRRISLLYRNIDIVGTYTAWDKALEALRTQQCDVLFLDVSMPGKNGFDLLKLVPGLDTEVIFVTAHDNYALNAFAVSATGYVVKPVDDIDLSTAIDKAIERVENKRKASYKQSQASHSDKIGIPGNHGIDYMDIQDIMYLESLNKCTRIVTTKGEHTSSLNIGKFQHLIDQHNFFQVHRSYVINLKYILRYESSMVVIMSDKSEIPVSRTAKGDFLRLFNDIF